MRLETANSASTTPSSPDFLQIERCSFSGRLFINGKIAMSEHVDINARETASINTEDNASINIEHKSINTAASSIIYRQLHEKTNQR
jgi:hypothetical protein